ncbi:polysaccharide deacetylase family protein [Wenzhouxiangella sp. EGI_FJ10305]|uniref:polysaccharide deacetylase family protein n=1 Tax=Wenzhouxiangella sp. EGI_FJ10305 TaxID=3243768 RepID=UPI0035DC13D4
MPIDTFFTCTGDRAYALTFDDGPSANIPDLLEVLDKHGVKATFFVVGANLEKSKSRQRLKAVHESGHSIANHTYSHADLTKLTAGELVDEVERTRDLILEVLGSSPRLQESTRVVRPPFGYLDKSSHQALRRNGFTAVLWNGDRYDWKIGEEQLIFDRIVQQLDYIADQHRRGIGVSRSILDLNHDANLATIAAIDRAIPVIERNGYEFVTLEQCLR